MKKIKMLLKDNMNEKFLKEMHPFMQRKKSVIQQMKYHLVMPIVCIMSMITPLSQSGCSDENVLAKIGERKITEKDLDTLLQEMSPRKRNIEAYKKRALKGLIDTIVFSREARSAGMENSPDIKKELKKITDETLARAFVVRYIDDEAEPTEEILLKNYNENRENFVVPESVTIQHLLVKKKDTAERLLDSLKNGQSWKKLAQKKSICKCWKKEGLHKPLYKGKMDPEFEKLVFNLEEGKLNDKIFKTKKGFQIIKLINKSEKREISFEEARKRIRYRLFSRKKMEVVNRYYKEASVTIFNPARKGVLAKIGKETITEKDFAHILSKVSKKGRKKTLKKWVKYLIEVKVFSNEAKKAGLEKDPVISTSLKRKIDNSLASAFRKKYLIENVKTSDKAIEDYYQTHTEEFFIPLTLRVKYILVKDEGDAKNILKKLKSGTAFGLLAMKKSIHPSSSKAGEIGWFKKGEKQPYFEKAVLGLKKNEISDIIETDDGYEIIKLIDRKGGIKKPFKEVKEEAKSRLKMKLIIEGKEQYYKKAGVKIFS